MGNTKQHEGGSLGSDNLHPTPNLEPFCPPHFFKIIFKTDLFF